MPLLDHFHPPLSTRRRWESVYCGWAGTITGHLNEALLPGEYFAEEQVHVGPRIEIDVATFSEEHTGRPAEGGTATLPRRTWQPATPALAFPAEFPDQFEVLVYADRGGPRLVAAIELVSPANKDRPAKRRGFAAKCAGYLSQGISLILIDIVTGRSASLHREILELVGGPAPDKTGLGAVAYRAVVHDGVEQIEVWPESLTIGEPLPTVPLWLDAETSLPLDLELTYTRACELGRIG